MRERAPVPSRITSRTLVVLGAGTLTMAAQALSIGPTAGAAVGIRPQGTAGATRVIPRAYIGSQGRIAFVRNGNVFTIKPTVSKATGLKQLTTTGHASGPRWSPNGKRLAFLHRGNLWIMNANGSHKAQITAAPSRSAPARSARRAYGGLDGRIAFVRNGNIFSVKQDGTGLMRLTRSGHASGPRWSPNGAQIAYLNSGDLWIMNADGSHKSQITKAAPRVTDSRPTWSPDGRYLAFVKTPQHHSAGTLTRYDTSLGQFAPLADGAGVITALAAPVAWTEVSGPEFSVIVYEGIGPRCATPLRYCLDLVGYPAIADTTGGTTSLEYGSKTRIRLTSPDWRPNGAVLPPLNGFVLTTVENCAFSPCKHAGLLLSIPSTHPPAPILPGSYEGVYAPTAGYIAFVRNVRGVPTLFTMSTAAGAHPVRLALGTEPDWQEAGPLP